MVLAGEATPSRVELPLLKAVARARRWALELISGQVNSVDEIARREHLDKRSVRRLLRLGFLSPRIIEAIAEGHQPPDLTVFSLMRRVDLPLLWNAQEQARKATESRTEVPALSSETASAVRRLCMLQ
jgi:site-specific DNA recombinase